VQILCFEFKDLQYVLQRSRCFQRQGGDAFGAGFAGAHETVSQRPAARLGGKRSKYNPFTVFPVFMTLLKKMAFIQNNHDRFLLSA
jgi:hypothetical protein